MDSSLGSNPGIKFRSDEETLQTFQTGHTKSGFCQKHIRYFKNLILFYLVLGLTTFVPGKISNKFVEIFEGNNDRKFSQDTNNKPPRRKILNADKVFKKVSLIHSHTPVQN